MKKLITLISIILASLLCFSACEKIGPADEETNAEETTTKETNGEETKTDDTKTDMSIAGTYTASFRLSSIGDDVSITLNEDSTFEITIDEEDSLGIEGLKAKYLYSGSYSAADGVLICASGKASFTLSTDDRNSVISQVKAMGVPASAVSKVEDALENGTALTEEDLGMIPYDKTVFCFANEDGKPLISRSEEWYGDSEYAHFICTYENGIINTKTLYDRSGGITYVDYYVDGKLDHTVNYDVYGNPIN